MRVESLCSKPTKNRKRKRNCSNTMLSSKAIPRSSTACVVNKSTKPSRIFAGSMPSPSTINYWLLTQGLSSCGKCLRKRKKDHSLTSLQAGSLKSRRCKKCKAHLSPTSKYLFQPNTMWIFTRFPNPQTNSIYYRLMTCRGLCGTWTGLMCLILLWTTWRENSWKTCRKILQVARSTPVLTLCSYSPQIKKP